ncbi:MAG: DUF5666 domain-containing protein [Parcubacteria group bacterium]
MKKNLIITIIVAVVVCVAAFFGGMKYSDSKQASAAAQRATQFGAAGLRGGNRQPNAGLVTGEIISKDDNSITVKMRDNSSKIIFYSASTEVSKFASGTVNDLAVGTTIMVNGKTGSDGSVTAQTIQIRPAMPTPTNQTLQK